MERCPSGEDLIIKARKPYTITKQRERWTEEEHNRFIEALKLYGRAWQRIEEHIGTKTAVQIRSHAQKFFSKLEKEAAAKGIPLGEVHDIEIPPPRPKRKPNSPYPRKVRVDVISSRVEAKDGMASASVPSSCSKKKALDLEMDAPLEEHIKGEASGRTEGASKDSNCLLSLSLFQDVPCASIHSTRKGPIDDSGVREFAPLVKEINDKPTDDDHSSTVKEKLPDNTDLDVGRLHILRNDAEMKLAQTSTERTAGRKQPQTSCISQKNKVEGNHIYPKHVPVYSIEGENNESVKNGESDATNLTSLPNKVGVHTHSNSSTIPSISATAGHHNSASGSSVHQQFATFPPFSQSFGARDAYRSFFNASSTFSSLLESTLLQNPAAHAAASLAASFWPTADVETSNDSASDTLVGGTPSRHMNHTPSMAALAASTVAAASSWWATHGLLPFYHPAFHNCFTFAPLPMSIIPRTGTAQPTEDNGEKEVGVTDDNAKSDQQIFDPEFSEAPRTKPSPLSSSDSDESQGKGRTHALGQKDSALNKLNSTPDSCLQESLKARSKKKVDLSSCGSNALSNSEMVTNNASKNLQEEGREDPRASHLCHPLSIEKSYRRLRGCGNVSDSWKEVSKEGRLAFQALWSREVLPQSFSPPRAEDGMMENGGQGREDAAWPVELCFDPRAVVTDNRRVHVVDQTCCTNDGCHTDKGLRTTEIGQGLLQGSRRTGFKPYKKCAMEAEEKGAAPLEEKCNKRIRLEGEASI